jgi:hypothetical protein
MNWIPWFAGNGFNLNPEVEFLNSKHRHPIEHWPKMVGTLNAGDGGDRGDRGDAPAKRKKKILMGRQRPPGRLGHPNILSLRRIGLWQRRQLSENIG